MLTSPEKIVIPFPGLPTANSRTFPDISFDYLDNTPERIRTSFEEHERRVGRASEACEGFPVKWKVPPYVRSSLVGEANNS